MNSMNVIVIGASAGGISTVKRLLSYLQTPFYTPLIIAQHLPADSTINPQLIFGSDIKNSIEEVVDKLPLEKERIYFAPPNYHLLLERDGTLSLSQDDPVNYSRPSIDVLFDSVAAAFGARACGILMTGANADGARGLMEISEAGGLTFVQDPLEAEAKAMPQSAISLFKPSFVGGIREIALKLMAFDRGEPL